MSNASNGDIEMRSTYHIFKPARDLITNYKINNTEFSAHSDNQEVVTNTTATPACATLSANLAQIREENRTQIVLKSDNKIPEFLFGAFLPLDKVINLIFNYLGKVVAQIQGAILHDALGKPMLLGCADLAEMDSLPDVNKHVISFCLVPTSQLLI